MEVAQITKSITIKINAGLMTPLDMIAASADAEFFGRVVQKVKDSIGDKSFGSEDVSKIVVDIFSKIFDLNIGLFAQITNAGKDIFSPDNPYSVALLVAKCYRASKNLAEIGYLRTSFTSELVRNFIEGVRVKVDSKIPALSRVFLDPKVSQQVEVLKHFTFEFLVASPRIKVVEHSGYDIIRRIFEALSSNTANRKGFMLLPADTQLVFQRMKKDGDKKRVIFDFIAGMTDRYAVEFHDRIFSENTLSMFKPL